MSKDFVIIIIDVLIIVYVDDMVYKGYEVSDVILMFESLGFIFFLNKLGVMLEEIVLVELDDIIFDIVEEVIEEMF